MNTLASLTASFHRLRLKTRAGGGLSFLQGSPAIRLEGLEYLAHAGYCPARCGAARIGTKVVRLTCASVGLAVTLERWVFLKSRPSSPRKKRRQRPHREGIKGCEKSAGNPAENQPGSPGAAAGPAGTPTPAKWALFGAVWP